MIKFHFCKPFVKKIKGQSFEAQIEKKFNDLSKHSRLYNSGSMRDYANGLYTLTMRNPQAKIIIEHRNINEQDVYFVTDFVQNKDSSFYFNKFIYPDLNSGQYSQKNPIAEEDIQEFIERDNLERTKVNGETIKPAPNEDLTNWLQEYELKIKYDVYESEAWVKYSLSESDSQGMRDRDVKLFSKLLIEITEGNLESEKKFITKKGDIELFAVEDDNLGILYSEARVEDLSRFMLFNGAHLKTQQAYWEKVTQSIKEEKFSLENTLDSLARYSYRAYPKWTILNDDLWFSIQKNDEFSNLSLTQEQLMFFKDFRFPYYINGQAGSGKSTMLYYLFSNAYWYKCQDYIKGDIIFLTENKSLLDHTQKSVFDLLSNNPEFNGLSVEQISQAQRSFYSFKDFILGLVPIEDKLLFPNHKYLNFSKFKTLYEDSNIELSKKRKYSAEEAWFTITTYIYGYDISKKIGSEEYETEVYSKSQKIPKTKFTGIEDNVLPFYEKLIEEEGYWDKLKMIRYLYRNNIQIPKFSLVVCDEAQDFCRIELLFILNLSEYLDYDLSNQEQIPIIFAGDPNQTVSPTGFREREMTEMLYTELKQIANFNYNKDASLYTPKYNYRSKQPVVTLANFVQYYRKKQFDIRLVEPQVPKIPETSLEPVPNLYFSYSDLTEDEDVFAELISKIKYKVFIVPIDQEEKDSYVQENSILSSFEKIEIRTSVEAKGAEYGQVVLYGFGEHYLNSFNSLADGENINDDESFKQAFFFNKLYVAITRAQSELIIIDSKDSKDKFWMKLVDEANLSGLNWEKLKDVKDRTIEYSPGSLNSIIESTRENAIENAQQDKTQGIYDKNPSRLRIAANQFHKIDDYDEFYKCLALAEEYKNNWDKASEYYLKVSKNKGLENAARCYFNGKYFKELRLEIGTAKLKSITQDIRILVAKFMSAEKLEESDIKRLNNNKEILSNVIEEVEWRDDFIDQVIRTNIADYAHSAIRNLVEILNVIVGDGDLKLWEIIGELNFKLHNYENAILAWDRLSKFETKEYAKAKVELARDNDDEKSELIWLRRLKEFEDTDRKKEKLENRIIEIYDGFVNSENQEAARLFFLYAYSTLLIRRPNESVATLGIKVEKLFEENLMPLIAEYEYIMTIGRANSKVEEFALYRWAKNFQKYYSNASPAEGLRELNSSYKTIAKKASFHYASFSIDELDEIAEYPESLGFHPRDHIKNIEVKCFRKFENLRIENIGLFNLIVGDNNVGKTSILEAFLFNHNTEEFLKNLAFAYQERKNSPRYISPSGTEGYKLNHNFLESFINTNSNCSNIEYTIWEDKSFWEYSIEKIDSGDKIPRFDFIRNGEQEVFDLKNTLEGLIASQKIMTPLIPYGKGHNRDLASVYYEQIEKIKSVRKDFTQKMEVFIPDIENIIVNTENGEIIIEENSKDFGIPLNQYGEGANKLFRILLQIKLQEGKKLLIDEVDAGIHHTRFMDFWKAILIFGKYHNTQILATTHNLECIRKFNILLNSEEFKEFQNLSRVITIQELPSKEIKAYTRTYNEFDYELLSGMELRGE